MNIRKNVLIGSALAAAMGLGVSAPALAVPVTRIANSVPNLTTSDTLYTVPGGSQLLVKSVVIAGGSLDADLNCARLYSGGDTPKTGCISVKKGDTAMIDFRPGIRYSAGQTLQVRNGSSAGPLHFTVHGNLSDSPILILPIGP